MEDLPGDVAAPLTSSRRRRGGTVLLVDDDGRVRPIRWYRTTLWAMAVVTVISLAAAAAGVGLYLTSESAGRRLDRALKVARDEIATLRAEHWRAGDLFGEAAPGGFRPSTPAIPPTMPHRDEGPFSVGTVSVTEFSVNWEEGAELVVELRLETGETDERISGFMVVVLRLEGEGRYLPLPRVPLVGGRPTGETVGKTFSIANYRWMTFRAPLHSAPDNLSGATVFVFDTAGALIYERDFAVVLENSSGADGVRG